MLRVCSFSLIVWTLPLTSAQAPYSPLDGPRVVTEDFKMTGSDADSIAAVGWSVGTAGTGTSAFIVAGAFRDNTEGPETGAAYIFRHTGVDWIEEQKLLASDAHDNDSFGQSAAANSGINGDFIVVGAPKWPAFGRLGAVYVFQFDETLSTWLEQARLNVEGAVEDDAFGVSVDIDDEFVIASAPGEDGIGAAYVYRGLSDGQGGYEWLNEARLRSSDAQAKDGFGRRVAIVAAPGDTLALVGTSSNITPGGAAYVFRREVDEMGESTWVEEAKLVAGDGEAFDWLGWAVDLAETSEGTFALVGAPGDDSPETNRGSAYLFRRNPVGGGTYEWVEEAKILASDGTIGDSYGWSVSITETEEGVVALVATRSHDDSHGAGYVYVRQTAGDWSETAKLVASDSEPGDELGYAATASEDWVVLGAPLDDPMGGPAGRGAVYAYNIESVLVANEGPELAIDTYSVDVWPNPALDRVSVSYSLPEFTHVQIILIDILGREVFRQAGLARPAGVHVELVDLSELPAGRYFVQLSTPHYTNTQIVTKAANSF